MFELAERGFKSVFQQLVACIISIRTRDEVSLPTPMRALEQKLPRKYWIEINRLLVPFGKHIWTGRLPRCSTCPVLKYCRQVKVTAHRQAKCCLPMHHDVPPFHVPSSTARGSEGELAALATSAARPRSEAKILRRITGGCHRRTGAAA